MARTTNRKPRATGARAKATSQAKADLQGRQSHALAGILENLCEVASAIREWRQANTITHGMVGLSALALHVVTLAPELRTHAERLRKGGRS